MVKYNERLSMLWEHLGSSAIAALATSHDNIPTVRTMSVLFWNGNIYFQTDTTMNKAVEISSNPRVALSIHNIQIQGHCLEMGHPLMQGNQWFAMRFQNAFPEAFKKYSHIPTERIYKIVPTEIKIWGKQSETPCIEQLNLEKKSYSVKLFEEY